MFGSFLWFELRGHLRRPSTWLYFGILLLLGFAATSSAFMLGVDKVNAPFIVTLSYLACVMIGQVITSALVGRSIPRDSDDRVYELLSTKGLTRNGYLAAKFLAAFAAMLVVFVALPLGSLVGSLMPWIDQHSLVSIRVWNYLQPFLTVVVPDVFFVSALFFAVGAVTRKQFVVYTTGFLLLVAGILIQWLDNEHLAMLLDPFGGFPLTMRPGSDHALFETAGRGRPPLEAMGIESWRGVWEDVKCGPAALRRGPREFARASAAGCRGRSATPRRRPRGAPVVCAGLERHESPDATRATDRQRAGRACGS